MEALHEASRPVSGNEFGSGLEIDDSESRKMTSNGKRLGETFECFGLAGEDITLVLKKFRKQLYARIRVLLASLNSIKQDNYGLRKQRKWYMEFDRMYGRVSLLCFGESRLIRILRGAAVFPNSAFAVAVAWCWLWLPASAQQALTNEDVMRLSAAGIDDEAIVAMIESSPTAFDTSVDSVLALAEAGIGNAVIAAMVAEGAVGFADVADGRDGGRSASSPRSSGARIPPVGGAFSDPLSSGGFGPEMVVIPAAIRFQMGCVSRRNCNDDELPVHDVTIPRAFAVSRYEVTFGEWDACVEGGGCRGYRPHDIWGRGLRPVNHVSWNDAQAYVSWLSSQTGVEYRLLSEAEWEYVARAGSETSYSWGNRIGSNRANCEGCGSRSHAGETAPVGAYPANEFGVYDMHGNVHEWVEDCWNANYEGAPSDSSAWQSGSCSFRVLRGGSWNSGPLILRSAFRFGAPTETRHVNGGFRVARTLTP